jgi:hypothetical protein
MNPELKTISYRGGVVVFRIPAHWREEYGPDGGGTFYEDAPESATFRLEVITLEAPFPVTPASAPDILKILPQSSVGVEQLPSGCALIRFSEGAKERGQNLLITYWNLANPIPPKHARLATFSYTILERQQTVPRFKEELEMLDQEVRAAVFASEIGE